MSSLEKLEKLQEYYSAAVESLNSGDKRKALYYCDHVKDSIMASIYLLLAEIEEEEGKWT